MLNINGYADDVKVVGICTVLDKMDMNDPELVKAATEMYVREKAAAEQEMKENPNVWIGIPALEYCKECVATQVWCKQNKASYYGAPKEDFNIGSAIMKAKSEGNSIVVVENMS